MTRIIGEAQWRCVFATAALVVVAGCTPSPVVRVPEPEPAVAPRINAEAERQAIARHRKLAQEATRAGNYADAVAQWQILTLLVPGDATFREALVAARTSVNDGVREQIATANAALAANDTERATQALLRTLALDPENTDAARMLRDIDRRRMARLQADRAARVRIQDAMAIKNAMQKEANAGETGLTFDIDQAIEMFRGGDTAGGLRELRAYVDAHPENRIARQRAGQVVADRARELEDKGANTEVLNLYDQASGLYGAKAPWSTRAETLRKATGSGVAKGKPGPNPK